MARRELIETVTFAEAFSDEGHESLLPFMICHSASAQNSWNGHATSELRASPGC